MKNFVQPGDALTLIAPYDVASGAGFLVGGIFAVAAFAAVSGDPVEGKRVGVFDLAKVSAQAWVQGEPIYWDNTAKLCTNVPGDNLRVGFATAAAANPSSTGNILLTPSTLVGPAAPSTAVADLTDNSAGTANNATQALPDPTDTPASADALRDDLVATLLPALRNNFADVTAKINAILAVLRAKNIIAD
jgi:predicted RecA/RadA family phage recombinase